MADAGVLHGPVRHGRRTGAHRRHRALSAPGRRHSATTGSLAATALLFGSAILGAFIDNIPYAATMAPVVEGMAAQTPDAETGRALWWAFALGACFGGNGTAIAASANVVAIGIAQRAGHPITFWKFTKYGIVGHPLERDPRVGIRVVALLLSAAH